MISLRQIVLEFFEKENFDFKFVSKEDCEEFIRQHYLGKPPAAAQDYIGISYNGKLVGCVIYGAPTSVSLSKSINQQLPEQLYINHREISELKRLYVVDGEFDKKGLASRAISQGNQMVSEKRNIKLIVSYSNVSVHPNATVYKASNAIYNGQIKDKIRWVYPIGRPKFKRYLSRALRSNN